MRKLMWIALGLALMCAVSAYLGGFAVNCIGIVSVAVGLTAMVVGRSNIRGRIVALICIGAVLGWLICGIYETATLSKAIRLDQREIHIRAQVTDYSFETEYGTAAAVTIEVDGDDFSAQLYFNKI